MLKRLFTLLLLIASMACFAASASAQTLQAAPPIPPAPSWTGNYPGDPENWPSPEAACQAQHDYFNPNADLNAPSYNGGQFAHCNWQLNANSNTILPALASEHCPPGWNLSDPGICARPDYASDSRPQCNCRAAPPPGTPQPAVGDPIALHHGAQPEHEVDYAPADGRFAEERDFYSLGEDYTNVLSPTPPPGFGGRWRGVVPGRLAVSGSYAEHIEYLDVEGGFSIFKQ